MRVTDTGVLCCNGKVQLLSALPSESVDLIYLDPPFLSDRTYEVLSGNGDQVQPPEGTREGGIEHSISWIRERGHELHRVLRDTGALYLHCDWHASYYLKGVLDEVFRAANLSGEMIVQGSQ